jgi:hypothetical protein
MHFYSLKHEGSMETVSETSNQLYRYMNKTGLSPELELAEVYHEYTPDISVPQPITVLASFLAWPEVFREQLLRVLDREEAEKIWLGGRQITPHTPVDERCSWVGEAVERLKKRTSMDDQFEVLSRVALIRPKEDVLKYKRMFEKTGDVTSIFKAQEEALRKTPTGGFVDPPRYDGKILHLSKVPYNKQRYAEAGTHEEKRKAYCFCSLVRNAANPRIDPIFCYRASGWARQFWEPILDVEFKSCRITHSILKGDDFCAWDYILD